MNVTNRTNLYLLPIAAVLTASCTFGPNYKRPVVETPLTYRGAPASTGTAASLADLKWFDLFKDEALTTLVESARNRGVTNVIFPPAPPTAFAVTSLPCKTTTFGSMKILPPFPSAPSTEVLTVLSTI